MISALALLLFSALPAGDVSPLLSAAPRQPRLLTDQTADGTVWVRGSNYKLALSGQGAKFIPRERQAQRSHHLNVEPVQASIGGQTLNTSTLGAIPVLDGTRVTISRGVLTEVWDLAADGARQSFVLQQRPGLGELLLRMPVAGDVRADDVDAARPGLRFVSPLGTEVNYGDLLIFDAAGKQLTRPSELDGDSIILRVPAEVIAGATYPLTVDPVLSSAALDSGSDDPADPDCAVDQSTSRAVYVYEDTFSGSDTDIVARQFTATGGLIDEVAVDISNDNTIDPAIANHELANQFLVVWTDTGEGLFSARKIEGRTRVANSTVQGPLLNLSFAQGDEATPDVGGTSVGGVGQPYFVVWSERGTLTNKNIRGRTVSTTGVLGSSRTIDDDPNDEVLPAITQDAGPAGRWMVAYQSDFLYVDFPVIRGAILNLDGFTLLQFDNVAALDVGRDSRPDVAGDGTEFRVVFQRRLASNDSNIFSARVSLANNTLQISVTDLTGQEPGANPARFQSAPSIARLADGFVYGYQESFSSAASTFDVFLATIDRPVQEGHVLISNVSAGSDSDVSLTPVPSQGRILATWTNLDAGDTDVEFAIYQAP